MDDYEIESTLGRAMQTASAKEAIKQALESVSDDDLKGWIKGVVQKQIERDISSDIKDVLETRVKSLVAECLDEVIAANRDSLLKKIKSALTDLAGRRIEFSRY